MRAAFLLSIAFLAGCAADAPENPRHRLATFGPAPGSTLGPVGVPQIALSPVQLGNCLRVFGQASADNLEYPRLDAALDARRRALDRAHLRLEAERPPPHASHDQVGKFNAAIAADTADVVAFNQAVLGSNQRKQVTAGLVAEFNAQCAGRAYFLDERDRIEAGGGPRIP